MAIFKYLTPDDLAPEDVDAILALVEDYPDLDGDVLAAFEEIDHLTPDEIDAEIARIRS